MRTSLTLSTATQQRGSSACQQPPTCCRDSQSLHFRGEGSFVLPRPLFFSCPTQTRASARHCHPVGAKLTPPLCRLMSVRNRGSMETPAQQVHDFLQQLPSHFLPSPAFPWSNSLTLRHSCMCRMEGASTKLQYGMLGPSPPQTPAQADSVRASPDRGAVCAWTPLASTNWEVANGIQDSGAEEGKADPRSITSHPRSWELSLKPGSSEHQLQAQQICSQPPETSCCPHPAARQQLQLI